MLRIILTTGNIASEYTDAIVNAANTTLSGGGGVDGAIRKAAGPELWEECRQIGHCNTGRAIITKGYKLLTKYVIHTVGPIYGAENGKEPQLLQQCYESCLEIAQNYQLESIAFPSISTGAYGYPSDLAAKVAVKSLQKYQRKSKNASLTLIKVVVFSPTNYEIYQKTLSSYNIAWDKI